MNPREIIIKSINWRMQSLPSIRIVVWNREPHNYRSQLDKKAKQAKESATTKTVNGKGALRYCCLINALLLPGIFLRRACAEFLPRRHRLVGTE